MPVTMITVPTGHAGELADARCGTRPTARRRGWRRSSSAMPSPNSASPAMHRAIRSDGSIGRDEAVHAGTVAIGAGTPFGRDRAPDWLSDPLVMMEHMLLDDSLRRMRCPGCARVHHLSIRPRRPVAAAAAPRRPRRRAVHRAGPRRGARPEVPQPAPGRAAPRRPRRRTRSSSTATTRVSTSSPGRRPAPRRRRERGFDQGELLARHIGAQLGVPGRRLLDRDPTAGPQTGRTRRERLAGSRVPGPSRRPRPADARGRRRRHHRRHHDARRPGARSRRARPTVHAVRGGVDAGRGQPTAASRPSPDRGRPWPHDRRVTGVGDAATAARACR